MSNKTLHIEVPETFEDNFGNPINQVFNILPELNKDWETIVVDFSKNKFLVPHYLGPLACILEEKRRRWIEVKVINETFYTQTVHFKNGFFKLPYNDENINFEAYMHKTFIPVIHFPTSKLTQDSRFRVAVLSSVNQILKKQLNLPINILQAIYYMLDELTQNIVDHSEIPFGTIFAQFYPGKKYLDLSICDSGKGLYQSYLDSEKHNPKSNTESINYGVYGKSTKDIPESRGFGLNTSRNMLTQGMRGQFFLMTGNGFFYQNQNKEEIVALSDRINFKGCMINLRIPLLESDDFSLYSFTDL